MLPPFVPPSARKANDRLPSINDFVVEPRVKPVEETAPLTSAGAQNASALSSNAEMFGGAALLVESREAEDRDAGLSAADSVAEASAEVTTSSERAQTETASARVVRPLIEYSNKVPSIEEFVARPPYVAKPGMESAPTPSGAPEFVQIGLGSSVSDEVPGAQETKEQLPMAEERLADVGLGEQVSAVEGKTAEQTIAERTVLIESVEGEGIPPALNTESDSKTAATQDETTPAVDVVASNDWVEAERDSFDWQSVANLAVSPAEMVDDEQRAADAWMSTDWSTPSSSPTEHIASVLLQLARRIRSGELEVDAPRGTSTEAALAAVLTALLSQPNGLGDR